MVRINLFKVTRTLLVLGLVTYAIRWFFHVSVDLTHYRGDGWFGVEPRKEGSPLPLDDPAIRPFTINITEFDLIDLKRRLRNVRYVDHLRGTQFTYGFSSMYLKKVVNYWRDVYNWREEESELNAHPQFHTQIEGLDVHFVHVKPLANGTTKPLLLIHSWPGSFYEYYKAIPLLTEVDKDGLAFEVVIPSIPGFGYSEAPHQEGFNASAAARVFIKLMERLGHRQFIVHGGDLGNIIARTMAVLYPEHLLGVHLVGNLDALQILNSPFAILKSICMSYFPRFFFFFDRDNFEYSKLFPLRDKLSTLLTESGYWHLQATKPDTVAAALNDSPAGLAAFILGQFSALTNVNYKHRQNGGLTEKFSMDELLTNIMVYWTAGNIASTARFYKETFADSDIRAILSQKIKVPAATVDAPHHLIRTPQKLVVKNYLNLLQSTNLPRGGHMTTFEEPQLVCKDLRAFAHKLLYREEHIRRQSKPRKHQSKEL